MSKWPMRGHFRYLRFKTFPMTSRTPQCEVFFPFLSSFEHSRVPEDSNSQLFQVLGFTPTLGQSGVATIEAGVGWPRGGGTLLSMPASDVCQGCCMHQPPKRRCHLQLQVPISCETRLPSQPPTTIWVIFGCPRTAFG
jgi:hypothetical protein